MGIHGALGRENHELCVFRGLDKNKLIPSRARPRPQSLTQITTASGPRHMVAKHAKLQVVLNRAPCAGTR